MHTIVSRPPSCHWADPRSHHLLTRYIRRRRYIVAASNWSVNGSTYGLGIKIQSTRAPAFLEERVEAFLEAFGKQLAALTDEQFAAHKEGLIVKKLQRVKNLGEETARFWTRITAGHYDFLRRESLSLAGVFPRYTL